MNENTAEDENKEKLPFSFKKKEVSDDKIAAHWQKIAAKLLEKDVNSDRKSDGKDK